MGNRAAVRNLVVLDSDDKLTRKEQDACINILEAANSRRITVKGTDWLMKVRHPAKTTPLLLVPGA